MFISYLKCINDLHLQCHVATTNTQEVGLNSSANYCFLTRILYLTIFHDCKPVFGSYPSNQVTLSSLTEQQATALQERALNLIMDTQSNLIDSLLNIYQLKSLDLAILRMHIVKLQSLNCYKEVRVSFDA